MIVCVFLFLFFFCVNVLTFYMLLIMLPSKCTASVCASRRVLERPGRRTKRDGLRCCLPPHPAWTLLRSLGSWQRGSQTPQTRYGPLCCTAFHQVRCRSVVGLWLYSPLYCSH